MVVSSDLQPRRRDRRDAHRAARRAAAARRRGCASTAWAAGRASPATRSASATPTSSPTGWPAGRCAAAAARSPADGGRAGASPRWPTCRRPAVAVVVTHGGTAGRLVERLLGHRPRPPPGARAAGQLRVERAGVPGRALAAAPAQQLGPAPAGRRGPTAPRRPAGLRRSRRAGRRTPTGPTPTRRRADRPADAGAAAVRPAGAATGGLASPGVRRRRHRFDGLPPPGAASRGTASTSCRCTSSCPAGRVARACDVEPGGRRPGAGRPRPDGLHVPADPGRLRRRLPARARRRRRPHRLGAPLRRAVRHLGRRAAGRLPGRRAPRDRRRLPVGGHGVRLRRARRGPVRRRRRRRRGGRRDRPARPRRRRRTFFVVDTLEHLRRGGRIGAAAAVLGSALAVKPVLHVQDGRVVPLEKVRTAARANSRLVQRAVEAAGEGPVSVAVHHLAAAERADRLAAELRERLPGAARAARQRARRGDRGARRARARSASSSRRSGAAGRTSETRRRLTAAVERHMGGSLPLSRRAGGPRRPQAAVASTDPPRGRSRGRALPSVRPVRLSSRRSDDADVIRARLRALLDGGARPRGLAARRRPTTRRPADEWDDGRRSPSPVVDEPAEPDALPDGLGRHRAPGPHARAGTRAGRAPGRCGSPAWSRPSC